MRILAVACSLSNHAEMIAKPRSFPPLIMRVVARGMCDVVYFARDLLVLSSTNYIFSTIQGRDKEE